MESELLKTKVSDFIDFEKVNTLLEGFNKSTGFVTAILDLDGNILSKSGWRQICTEFHRINPATSERCTVSDTLLAGKMSKGEGYHFYKCLNGLIDVAVPIVINGEHVANLFSGQFFFEKPDIGFFKKQAAEYGFEEEKYLAALKKVPVVSKEKVLSAMNFLLNMTQLISEMTYQKLEQFHLYEVLRKSEERSRNALNNLLEGCQIIDYNWKYVYLNRTAEIHNRRPNTELIGKLYMDMWPGIEETEVFKVINQTLVNRVSNHFENEFIFPDGSRGWYDLSIQPVQEGVFILSVDITNRKEIENALRENEKKYRLISDNTDDWIYWITPDGQLHYVSPACELVTGYLPEEFIINPELINEIVFEDDKKKAEQHTQIAILDNNTYNLDFRIVTKTGEIRWINHDCSPIFSDSGEYLGRRGTNRNITERKLAEAKLMESEKRYRMLFEYSPCGIVIANHQYYFTDVNANMCKMMGYTREELIGMHVSDIVMTANINDSVNAEKEYRPDNKEEKLFIRKDGSTFIAEVISATMPDGDPMWVIRDITDLKKAEENLKESISLMRIAGEKAKLGGWSVLLGENRLQWSDEVAAIHEMPSGYTPLVEDGTNFYAPEWRKKIIKVFTDCVKEGIPYDEEMEIITARGKRVWVRTIGEAIRDADGKIYKVQGAIQDISQQKYEEEKIREKDLMFRKLSSNVPDMIYQFIKKPDGTYSVPISSEGIRNNFGCSPEDVINDFSPITRVIYPEDTERVIRAIEYSAEHLTDFNCEYRVQIPGKPIQWIYSRSTPEKLPDGSITWYGFNADVTYRKKSEEAIQKLNSELEKRVTERTLQLEAANRELEAFSYSVSHDLRSPLRHINGFSEILINQYSDNLPEEARKHLKTITNSVKKMGILIDDLLSFSRTSRVELRKTNLKMDQLVEDSLSQIKPSIKDRNITWDISPLPEINGDYNLMLLVWVNLIDNAVKYTSTRDNSIIKIGYEDKKDETVFYIKDNGVGFDMKYADKLFGVFQRLHVSSQFEGTGIGLANAQRIILRHGGKIWAEAEIDKGAAFYFSIPKP
jgi:PAS domain S-box-containing protein